MAGIACVPVISGAAFFETHPSVDAGLIALGHQFDQLESTDKKMAWSIVRDLIELSC